MINFTNLSGNTEIGSNSYLLQIGQTNIILDSGMHPKREGLASQPNFKLIGDRRPDTIFVTHSHLDHIGTLPVLQEKQPQAEVIMTEATCIIGSAMLHNSVNVMTSKRINEGMTEYPFYTHIQLDNAEKNWTPRAYEKPFRIGEKQEVLATLFDAGHILGSCGVHLEAADGTTIFYTGDVQFENQSIIPGASFPEKDIDILIMECTHGNVETDHSYTRKKELQRLADSICRTLANNGAVLIPVFALGKSQEILFELERLRIEKRIPNVPIYFGGLSTKVTLLYDKLADNTPRIKPGYKLRKSIKTVAVPRKGKTPLNVSAGNIYLVSSGMISEHTISHTLAEQILPRKKDSIFLIGYSDPDSPAGTLRAAKAGDKVSLRPKGGQSYPFNCNLECFSFSGHATKDALLDYATRLAPKQILLVHGDPEALESMAKSLKARLPETKIIITEAGETSILK